MKPDASSRKAASYMAPEAVAGVLAMLGIPVAAVLGNLLLATLLGALAMGIFLRFWRRRSRRR